MTTLYDVLGVRPGASTVDIKRAYYRQARVLHPDNYADAPPKLRAQAERAMQELNVAWAVLRDRSKRVRYDATLDAVPHHPPRRRAPSNTGPKRAPSRPALGTGFRYWFGSNWGRGLVLLVDGATTLEPLRAYAPNGIAGLHAEGSAIDDAELLHLSGLTGLKMLDLSGTRVTDAGLVHLQTLQSLETLMLWDTAITDVGLALVGRLSSLCHLGLGNTAVTDAGLADLAHLRHLRRLQLAGTAVEGEGLRHLYELEQLESVSLPWRVRGRHRRALRASRPGLLVA